LLHRLQPPNGNLSPREAIELADAAQPKGAVFRINLDQGLDLYWREAFELPESVEAFTGKPVIVACPGSVTCSKGLVDCWAAAANIRDVIGGLSGPDMRICISGCPNNRAHSAVADIGLIGMLKRENGDSVQYYRLLRDCNHCGDSV
jgi:dissimilatory sulfite reductase (desulfoviridin) alpha/beta subunit